jgi:hypothetical protein
MHKTAAGEKAKALKKEAQERARTLKKEALGFPFPYLSCERELVLLLPSSPAY